MRSTDALALALVLAFPLGSIACASTESLEVSEEEELLTYEELPPVEAPTIPALDRAHMLEQARLHEALARANEDNAALQREVAQLEAERSLMLRELAGQEARPAASAPSASEPAARSSAPTLAEARPVRAKSQSVLSQPRPKVAIAGTSGGPKGVVIWRSERSEPLAVEQTVVRVVETEPVVAKVAVAESKPAIARVVMTGSKPAVATVRVVAEAPETAHMGWRAVTTDRFGEADGRIVLPEDAGYAWIDLGEKHGLHRGMRFATWRAGPEGEKTLAAVLVVDEVGDGLSSVEIHRAQAGSVDLEKGAPIASPFFTRGARTKVALLGPTGAPDRAALVERLGHLGADVVDRVDAETDFVVALDERSARLAAAAARKDGGPALLRIEDLAPFLAGVLEGD